MIIKRKYLTYGRLLEDPASKEAIYNSIKNCKNSLKTEEIDRLMMEDAWVIAANTDMGSGIPGEAFRNYMKEFEKLDKEVPFDNGFSYRDVTDVICFPSRQGRAVMQIMYRKIQDLNPEIVQVIAFETDGDSINQVEEWDVGTIYL